MQEIRLSSGSTKFLLFALILLSTLFTLAVFLTSKGEFFTLKLIAAKLAFLSFLSLTAYFVIFITEVYYDGTTIKFKRVFRKAENYSWKQIIDTKSVMIRSTKFTMAYMRNENGSISKYLILKNGHYLFGDTIDAEDILIDLKHDLPLKSHVTYK